MEGLPIHLEVLVQTRELDRNLDFFAGFCFRHPIGKLFRAARQSSSANLSSALA
jgi:hypothetical protein